MSPTRKGIRKRNRVPLLQHSPGSDDDDDEVEASNKDDEPFIVTFCKVGSTILALMSVSYLLLELVLHKSPRLTPREYHFLRQELHLEDGGVAHELPPLELHETSSQWDAFGIVQEQLQELLGQRDSANFGNWHRVASKAQEMQTDFSHHYGGDNAARWLLQESMKVLTPTKTTNTRDSSSNPWVQLLERAIHGRLTMVFVGQSVSAGYGNRHDQAFPHVLQQQLGPLLKLLDIELVVHNIALEHASAFPFTWCLSNYIQAEDNVAFDVISWDFGPATPQELEIFVPNILNRQSKHPPLFLFRDSLQSTSHSILQEYVDLDVLQAPLVYNLETAAIQPFLDLIKSKRPPGFQEWKEYGVPQNILQSMGGDETWTRQQHELIGLCLTMWFTSHVEQLVATRIGSIPKGESSEVDSNGRLPPPILAGPSSLQQPWSHLLYDGGTSKGVLHCRTSFDPADDLKEIILSGIAVEEPQDKTDLMHPKGALYYTNGWVSELEAAERREKKLTAPYDFMGMVDTTKAYYGVTASGPLRLFLPTRVPTSLILCESNASRGACSLGRDVQVKVGGSHVVQSLRAIDSNAVTFNNKQLCYWVALPTDNYLRLTTVDGVGQVFEVEISVTNKHVRWNNGPCSIAHVLWEAPE